MDLFQVKACVCSALTFDFSLQDVTVYDTTVASVRLYPLVTELHQFLSESGE